MYVGQKIFFMMLLSLYIDCLQLSLLAPVLTDLTTAAHTLISGLIQHILHTVSTMFIYYYIEQV